MKTNAVRSFMRREDYVPERLPPGNVCRSFVLHCFRCQSYDVRFVAQFDEEAGELALWLACRCCGQRERLTVK